MKAIVNQEGCICPEVFAFDEDGVAIANGQMDDANYAVVESARNACPVEVIDIVED